MKPFVEVSTMGRFLVLAYSVVCYVFFLLVMLYTIGFIGNLGVPKSIDSGRAAELSDALLVNLGILLLFVVQHTIMARPAFKRAWAKFLPAATERSTFVLLSSGILALLMGQWRPLPQTIWSVDNIVLVTVLMALFWLGWVLVIASTFLIDHADLFGLRQAWLYFKGREYTAVPFVMNGLYRRVRHPLMLGFLIGSWVTPDMSLGHLIFALAITGYIVLGVRIEERDLLRFLGEEYRKYQASVPMLIPLPGKSFSA